MMVEVKISGRVKSKKKNFARWEGMRMPGCISSSLQHPRCRVEEKSDDLNRQIHKGSFPDASRQRRLRWESGERGDIME